MNNDHLVLHDYTEDAYLEYAIATVKGRALAQVEDGQKPVQRRILYAMRGLGLSATSKPVKSARIVGDVLGKYHPHGDSAAYEAMVRMAQNFSLRYPLIHGQGNYGSRDGDPAAAMRYTEARLAPVSDLLLNELGQGTVDFDANYDGTLEEPRLLPARLPFLLLNGTMGIAVGMASDVPSHNLREVAAACVALVEDPTLTLDGVCEHIKGPDFPGGGQIVSTPQDIKAAYATGRGTIRCRARWVKEDLARGQWQIVITELPYQVSTKNILEQLDTLTNPQPAAGKKTINQQQANLKQLALDFLEKAVDESDKSNAVRLVLVPRTSKVDIDQLMAFLLANTSLEVTVSMNFTMVGLDGRPTTKPLLSVLSEWAQYRVSTVQRRTQWELDVTNRRIHILEGRMVVFLNLDAVIATIREADDPKQGLQDKFSLSEEQANDILEMRLRQLNRLEGIKLERELEELRKEATRLLKLLSSEKALRSLIVKEIIADADKYGDDRRTLVKTEARVVSAAPVADEALTIVVSKNLWVKAYRGHDLEPGSFTFKQGDSAQAVVQTRTVNSVVVLDTQGRAYTFSAGDAPSGRGEGAPLSTFVELQNGARVHAVLSGSGSETFLFAGEQGCGFVSSLKSLFARPRAGKAFLTLIEGERPLQPVPVPADNSGFLVLGTADGRMLAYPLAEVKTLDKGKGVALMALDGQGFSAVLHVPALEGAVLGKVKEKETVVKLSAADWQKHLGRRARKGAALPKKAVLLGLPPLEEPGSP